MSKSGWIENVYLDLDVILAELNADDWLASDVDIDSIEEPKTSVATGIELQYVMEDEWDRDRVVRAHQEIAGKNIELVPLTSDALDAAAELRSQYESLNVFDGVHLGSAAVLDEPVVSTDTLFPEIPEIEHVDPRDLE
jgi:predicted nucleic acid-binding protein